MIKQVFADRRFVEVLPDFDGDHHRAVVVDDICQADVRRAIGFSKVEKRCIGDYQRAAFGSGLAGQEAGVTKQARMAPKFGCNAGGPVLSSVASYLGDTDLRIGGDERRSRVPCRGVTVCLACKAQSEFR